MVSDHRDQAGIAQVQLLQASFEIQRDFILDADTFLQAFFREVASGLAMAGRPRFEGITAA
jgi:hypothetical protein